jgi:hypothetical protein
MSAACGEQKAPPHNKRGLEEEIEDATRLPILVLFQIRSEQEKISVAQ